MRLITKRTVLEFAGKHPDARQALSNWITIIQSARWRTADDVKRTLSTARPIAQRRVVFKIGGNKYRIVCEIQYADDTYNGIVRILFIGTHAEYDRIDPATVKFR